MLCAVTSAIAGHSFELKQRDNHKVCGTWEFSEPYTKLVKAFWQQWNETTTKKPTAQPQTQEMPVRYTFSPWNFISKYATEWQSLKVWWLLETSGNWEVWGRFCKSEQWNQSGIAEQKQAQQISVCGKCLRAHSWSKFLHGFPAARLSAIALQIGSSPGFVFSDGFGWLRLMAIEERVLMTHL